MKIKISSKIIPQTVKALALCLGFLTFNSALAQDIPDFSGLWFPSRAPGLASGQDPQQMPLTDFAQQKYDAYVAAYGVDDDPGGFCIKPGLPRSIWGAPFPVEVVQTETFITMFWEGYFQYRKIYLDGFDRPDPILPSRMGYSVGHWEGDVLVVETTYLREFPYMRRLPNTGDAVIEERISMLTRPNANGVETRYLYNELTMTDPALYTQPVTVRGALAYSPDTPIMEYSCSETIYDEFLIDEGLGLPDLSQ